MLHQILAGRARLTDRAGWRDVIGGDAVPQQAQHARAADVLDRSRHGRHAVEVRSPADVRRVGLPDEAVSCRSEEHTSELQSQSNLVCRLLLEKKKNSDRCLQTGVGEKEVSIRLVE